MKTYTSLIDLPPLAPTSLTIGTFDGLHLGHQAILGQAKACLTFSNHPSTYFGTQTHLITTLPQKLALLRRFGVETVILLPFDQELANQDPKTFLTNLHTALPFNHLILGHDALLGKDRAGTPQVVEAIAKTLQFKLTYIDPVLDNGIPISSSRVRDTIAAGDLAQAERLLGRKVSFYSTVHRGIGKGRQIGFPTANIDISGLCTPPHGVYAVTLLHKGKVYPGIANLGTAPTIQEDRPPMLEVHLFNLSEDLYESQVEVVLHARLRSEKKFPSIDALRTQITTDITQAKTILHIV